MYERKENENENENAAMKVKQLSLLQSVLYYRYALSFTSQVKSCHFYSYSTFKYNRS